MLSMGDFKFSDFLGYPNIGEIAQYILYCALRAAALRRPKLLQAILSKLGELEITSKRAQ